MMASDAKEKLEPLQRDETKCHELLNIFRKSLNVWFTSRAVDNTSIKELLNACVEIILHGLKNEPVKLQTSNICAFDYDSPPTTSTGCTKFNKINKSGSHDIYIHNQCKIIDDFEWVRNAVTIRQKFNDTTLPIILSRRKETSPQNHYLPIPNQKRGYQSTIRSCVQQWLSRNLSEHNLCSFLQYLVNDKELLEEHYHSDALLRQEEYATVIKMDLIAFERKQSGIFNHIDAALKSDTKETILWKRSNSQPNAIFILEKRSSQLERCDAGNSTVLAFNLIRRTNSLPELLPKWFPVPEMVDRCSPSRTKYKAIKTSPRCIPQKKSPPENENPINSHIPTASLGSFPYDCDENLPTTSHASSNRSKSPLSNFTLNSNKSTGSSLISTSASSFNSNHTEGCIQLINTDNIKIWTDHSWELKQTNKHQKQLTLAYDIPTPEATTTKPYKSVSPLNSFFSTLFSTPPSYTSWFVDHDSKIKHETTETAIESIIPDNDDCRNRPYVSNEQSSSMSLGSTVFDKFLPIDGKKLRSRKSTNLFDEANVTLCSPGINVLVSVDTCTNESPSSSASMNPSIKNCESLTKFLQMSHLSRNNTDLEKENAHFRISEAVISAIGHIKWNKLEPQLDNSCCEATPLAMDCLALPDPSQCSLGDIDEEHLPYAEEVSSDQYSAEVVGLSLISKFDEKHLPKVSDLKWLVADDDTPQTLLPMPDLTSSANPDEHIVHSATRGTRYWAPPRQQIIFTDHPSPNRKELLKKQNNRCAGCGMRVSPEYIQSFRYCTYLGKYHCTGCHRNQISATPAKILQAWDFKCYPVSVFAYRLLEEMYAYPLFYVPDLNPALYIRCKSLLNARAKRLKLMYVKDFIRMCRFALREQNYFKTVPSYITADIDNWSMSDFIDVRTKCLHRSIDELINKCEAHIFSCVLCTARGFLCEHCHVDGVIYPWGSSVERCDRCGTCFHRNCWKAMSEKCYRCQRINKRQDDILGII